MANDDHEIPPNRIAPPGADRNIPSTPSHPTQPSAKRALSPLAVASVVLIALALISIAISTGLSTWAPSLFESQAEKTEKRYHNINEILDQIEYKTAGVILVEEYDDNGTSALNPAYFDVIYEGTEAYEVLKLRILEAQLGKCNSIESQLSCGQNPNLTSWVDENGNTHLSIVETGPGL